MVKAFKILVVMLVFVIGIMTVSAETFNVNKDCNNRQTWAPEGYCTTDSYDVAVTEAGNITVFDFHTTDSTYSFSYYVNLTDRCGLDTVIYNSTYAGVLYLEQLAYLNITANWTGSQVTNDGSVKTVMGRSYDSTNHVLHCDMREYKALFWIDENYTYYPGGKAMVVEMMLGGMNGSNNFQVSNVNYSWSKHLGTSFDNDEFSTYTAGEMSSNEKYNSFVMINDALFANVKPDSSFSWSTARNLKSPSAKGGSSYWGMSNAYNLLSNGSRQPVKERLYFVVSPEFSDVLRKIPNNASPMHDELYGKTVYQVQWENGWYTDAELTGYLDKYYAFGFRDLIYDAMDYGQPPYNDSFKAVISDARSKGYDVGQYVNAQDIPPDIAGTSVCVGYEDHAYIPMQSGTGAYFTCWGSSKCARHDYRSELIDCKVEAFAGETSGTGIFLDANTMDSKAIVDMNVNFAAKGIMWNTYNWTVWLYNHIAESFTPRGYVCTESNSGKHELNGIADCIEGGMTIMSNQKSSTPKVPDWQLNNMNKLSFVYAPYYRRYSDCDDNERCKWKRQVQRAKEHGGIRALTISILSRTMHC